MAMRLIRCLLFIAALTALLAWLQGGFDLYLGLYSAAWVIFGIYGMLSLDDDLARERFNPPEPGADRLSLRAIRIVALAHVVVGALDAGRWHLAPVEGPLRLIAIPAMLIGGILVIQSIRANRFFSAVIRVQTERGHRVVDTGPYRTIRHPGYLGMLIAALGSGVAIGSWLGFALAAVYGALIVRRVWFEDAFLKANLAGYQAYASRVSSRLLPGAW
jgi:protein-S-isoprenylcysteine O-methyltransferase Ste14